MTIEEIKELIGVVNESGIAELDVTRGDNRVRIRRSNARQEIILPASPMITSAAAPVSQSAAVLPSAASPSTPAVPDAAEDNLQYVKSPIVGTFYESPSPGTGAFVKIGDRVSAGQVLCIIESMKLMNEIECEISGTIVSRLVDNGKPVEYGESLFAIQPA